MAETIQVLHTEDPHIDSPKGPGARINARNAEWQHFRGRLTEALGCLEAGYYLILQSRDKDPYYVQFAAGGADGIRAEAVSNSFLPAWRRLDATAIGRLRRLGWRPPTDIGDGPVNWWRDLPAGAPLEDAAGLTVETMRKVFEIPRPTGLVYRAFARSGEEILLPTLALPREPKRLSLDERVAATLREFLDTEELTRDEDGDWPIRNGDDMVYVRVVGDPGFVAVFSPALLDVPYHPALAAAVNHFNLNIRCARASVVNGSIVIAAELDDQPEVEAGVVNAFMAVSELSDVCANQLQEKFGGRRFFGDPAPAPVQETGYGMYL
jgi:hypothetical protein